MLNTIPEKNSELDEEYENLVEKTKNIKKHRNKKIGHNDLKMKTENYCKLNGISRIEIDDVLKGIYKLTNEISKELQLGMGVIKFGISL